MTKAGKLLLDGMREVKKIVEGTIPAARITLHGQSYLPEEDHKRIDRENRWMRMNLEKALFMVNKNDPAYNEIVAALGDIPDTF